MKNLIVFALLGSLVGLMPGCSEPKAELIPASGIVKIDGEPAAGIMVQFVPDTIDETKLAPTSQALSDDEGKFDLFTLQNEKGAIAGPHRVSLIDTLEERVPQGQEATQPKRLASKFATGAITVNVEAGKEIMLEATGPK